MIALLIEKKVLNITNYNILLNLYHQQCLKILYINNYYETPCIVRVIRPLRPKITQNEAHKAFK